MQGSTYHEPTGQGLSAGVGRGGGKFQDTIISLQNLLVCLSPRGRTFFRTYRLQRI